MARRIVWQRILFVEALKEAGMNDKSSRRQAACFLPFQFFHRINLTLSSRRNAIPLDYSFTRIQIS